MALNEERDRLLNKIFASPQFSYADSLKRVLKYVCEHASDPEAPAPKEYEIAVRVLNRADSFDPKLDPVVRVSMSEIRERLRAFFASGEGIVEPFRLVIPKGHYRAVFEAALPAEVELPAASHSSNLRRFWAPYLAPTASNLVFHTEPLFLRDDSSGLYLRNLYVNDCATGLPELQRRVPPLAQLSLKPCYHYLSSGEVYCMFSLSRMFQDLDSQLQMRNSRVSFWSEVWASNLILLGCSRTNSLMDSLQSGSEILITDDALEIRNPRRNEQRRYHSERYLDGKLRRCTEYALVSRRPGLGGDCAVTLIASNHGNAIQGAGHFLTLDHEVELLIRHMGMDSGAQVPERFQLILRVNMIDVNDEVVGVEYVTHRIPQSPSSKPRHL